MDFDRYSRQSILSEIGAKGQDRLASSRVVVVGLGASGGITTEYLARAGVGYLRLIDRDIVEESNLSRQTLFTQKDADEGLPKALAAKRYLHLVNATIEIESHNSDLNASNYDELLSNVDIILDGTDNYPTRFLINDYSVKMGLPWIYTAVLGMEGVCMAIVPAKGPCLTCLMEREPEAGSFQTTECVGVLGPLPGLVSCLQSARAIRYLVEGDVDLNLVSVNIWTGDFRSRPLARRKDCPTCGRGEFPYLG